MNGSNRSFLLQYQKMFYLLKILIKVTKYFDLHIQTYFLYLVYGMSVETSVKVKCVFYDPFQMWMNCWEFQPWRKLSWEWKRLTIVQAIRNPMPWSNQSYEESHLLHYSYEVIDTICFIILLNWCIVDLMLRNLNRILSRLSHRYILVDHTMKMISHPNKEHGTHWIVAIWPIL